jgi:hypothetical protein
MMPPEVFQAMLTIPEFPEGYEMTEQELNEINVATLAILEREYEGKFGIACLSILNYLRRDKSNGGNFNIVITDEEHLMYQEYLRNQERLHQLNLQQN